MPTVRLSRRDRGLGVWYAAWTGCSSVARMVTERQPQAGWRKGRVCSICGRDNLWLLESRVSVRRVELQIGAEIRYPSLILSSPIPGA